LGVRDVVEISALRRLALSGRGGVRLRIRVVRLSPGVLCYCGGCRQGADVGEGFYAGLESGSAFQTVDPFISFRKVFASFSGEF